MDHLEHKFNLVLVLVHNIWLSKIIFYSQMQQTTMKVRHSQGFVTKNPNNVASNCKCDFFSSWMLENPNVNCQLGSNSSFHLSTLHFIMHIAWINTKDGNNGHMMSHICQCNENFHCKKGNFKHKWQFFSKICMFSNRN